MSADNGVRMSIGSFWFPYDERICVVARPWERDVALIDPVDFELIGTVEVGGRPSSAVVLRDGRVFARDAYAGLLLRSAT